MADITERVRTIIATELGIPESQVTLDATAASLGADSLDVTELVMAFEEEFGMEIPDDEAEKLVTVADVINYIDRNAGDQ